MRLHDGRYECILCGAKLDVPTDHEPRVTIRNTTDGGNVRVIRYQGKDIHTCPLRRGQAEPPRPDPS